MLSITNQRILNLGKIDMFCALWSLLAFIPLQQPIKKKPVVLRNILIKFFRKKNDFSNG